MPTSDSKIIPRQGILSIPKYISGKSGLGRLDNPIKLSANENPYGPSQKAIEVFKQSQHNLGVYPESNHEALRSAIADVMGIYERRIICGAGSDELINFLCQCYAGEGDEVIHTAHGFAMYRISALTVGATPIAIPENNRHADIPRIIEACNERTKLIFLANPNNPTGTFIDLTELIKLVDGIPQQTLLVLDGAYAEYIEKFDGGIELVDRRSNVFITRTFSKIHGLGSLRVGWGYGSEHIIDALQRVKGPFNISGVGQKVAAAAIKDIEYVEKCRKDNSKFRELLAVELRKINIPSDQSLANFLLLRFPNNNLAKLADQFLYKNGIIVRNVSNYGLENSLRVSIGTSSDCEQVLENLTEFQEINHAL